MKKRIVFIVSGILIIICGLIIVLVSKRNHDEWKKGLYFLDHCIVYNNPAENATVKVRAIAVGDDLVKSLADESFTGYSVTPKGREETEYTCSIEQNCKEYAVVLFRIPVSSRTEYIGFELENGEVSYETTDNFKINIPAIDYLIGDFPQINISVNSDFKDCIPVEVVINNTSDETVTVKRNLFLNPSWVIKEEISKPFSNATGESGLLAWEKVGDEIILPPQTERIYTVDFPKINPFEIRFEIPSFSYNGSIVKTEDYSFSMSGDLTKESILQFINGECDD